MPFGILQKRSTNQNHMNVHHVPLDPQKHPQLEAPPFVPFGILFVEPTKVNVCPLALNPRKCCLLPILWHPQRELRCKITTCKLSRHKHSPNPHSLWILIVMWMKSGINYRWGGETSVQGREESAANTRELQKYHTWSVSCKRTTLTLFLTPDSLKFDTRPTLVGYFDWRPLPRCSHSESTAGQVSSVHS
jgi:hypothetical protein